MFNQGIEIVIFPVRFVVLAGMFIPLDFASVIANIAVYFPAPRPYLPAWGVVVAKLLLRPDLVLLRTPLIAIGDRGQRTGAQALCFKGQAVAAAVYILHDGNLRHTVGGKPFIHRRYELIGVGLLRARVRKGDKVNRDMVIVKANK